MSTIAHVVARAADVLRHLAFERLHDIGVQVARAGDEVRFVGVLAGQLKADEVAAVVERLVLHEVVEFLVPPGGVHLADVTALAGGHGVLAHVRLGRAAASEQVKRRVGLVAVRQVGLAREVGHVAVDLEVGQARVLREGAERLRRRAGGGGVVRGGGCGAGAAGERAAARDGEHKRHEHGAETGASAVHARGGCRCARNLANRHGRSSEGLFVRRRACAAKGGKARGDAADGTAALRAQQRAWRPSVFQYAACCGATRATEGDCTRPALAVRRKPAAGAEVEAELGIA